MLSIDKIKKMSEKDISKIIWVGFGQSGDVKPGIWKKAKELMDFLVASNLGVKSFNFGPGKGKYAMVNKSETIDMFIKRALKFIKNYKSDEALDEVVNVNEFYKNKTSALDGFALNKFIRTIDKIKDNQSNVTIDELIAKTFSVLDESEFTEIETLVYSYIADEINLRDITKQLREFGLLRNV